MNRSDTISCCKSYLTDLEVVLINILALIEEYSFPENYTTEAATEVPFDEVDKDTFKIFLIEKSLKYALHRAEGLYITVNHYLREI